MSTYNGGYIALMTVLIVSAACVAISLALLVAGADSQRSTLISQRSVQTRTVANACAEEALQRINERAVTPTVGTITIAQGECSYSTVNLTPVSYEIDVTGSVENVVKKLKIYATISQSSITVTSWQEVTN